MPIWRSTPQSYVGFLNFAIDDWNIFYFMIFMY